jgi:CYTH domain-containing protein
MEFWQGGRVSKESNMIINNIYVACMTKHTVRLKLKEDDVFLKLKKKIQGHT